MSKKRTLPPKPKKKVEENYDEEENENDVEDEKFEEENVEDDVDDVEDDVGNDPKERKQRVRPTMEMHVRHYDELLALLDVEIDRKSREKEKGVRSFRKARKLIFQMRKELPIVTKSKIARKQCSTRKTNNGGLVVMQSPSDELADFLGIEPETQISRIEAATAICVYAHYNPEDTREHVNRWKHLNPKGKRDLQNPSNKKALIPDKKLIKLLNYDKYRKDVKSGKIKVKRKNKMTGKTEEVVVDDDTLFYYVIQRLISHHFQKE